MKIGDELSKVIDLKLVEVSYGIDGLGMKFDNPEESEKPQLVPCWCGSYHAKDDSPSRAGSPNLPPKPIGPPLKDMREGDIPRR